MSGIKIFSGMKTCLNILKSDELLKELDLCSEDLKEFDIEDKIGIIKAALDIKNIGQIRDKGLGEQRWERRDGAIHGYFELSYASWLVLPRTYMMDMPMEWQTKFVELLEQLDEITPFRDEIDFDIRVQAKKDGKFAKLPSHLCKYRYPEHDDVLKEQ